VLAGFALLVASAQAAGVDPALPRYEPRKFEIPEEVVNVVGYNDMRDMLEAMRVKFEAAHPGFRMKLDLPGTRFAPAALADGRSAFAPMGAEFTPPQLAEYRAVAHADPVAIRVAHASLDPRALSGPLAIFVHRENPLGALTLEQLARAFAGDAKTWGELGAGGDWTQRAVHPYGLGPATALGHFFQDRALKGQPYARRVTGFPQSTDVVKKVSEDALALGFAAAMREGPNVKALAIGDPPVALTAENIQAGRYPLDRYLLIYVRPPVAPYVREFLRFALSREGQEAVASSPQGYIPLSARDAAAELAKLP
jgi:phosphate transport system substrate-binding protein